MFSASLAPSWPEILSLDLDRFKGARSSTNIRLRWKYEPGSDLFVVYSEGRDTDFRGFPRIANRGFVIKFTKLFRM